MKKAITVLITDTHVHKDNQDLVLSVFREYFKLLRKLGLTTGIHLGDFFTNRIGQSLNNLYVFKEVSRMAVKYGVTLYIIPGNHDKTDQNDTRSYLGIFTTYSNIVVLDGSFMSKSSIDIEGINFHFLPYFKEEIYNEKLNLIKTDTAKKNVLCTHVGIEGVLNNQGLNEDKVISLGKFKPFDVVFIGHYHNRQKVGKKIWYIGSAYQGNYGEDTDKGFTIVYDDLSTELVKSTFKRFQKVVIDTFDKVKLKKLIDKYKVEASEANIRFVFVGTEEDFIRIDRSELQDLGIDVKFEVDSKVIEEQESQDVTASFSKKDVMKHFMSYCSENEIKGGNRSLGLKLIKERYDTSR